MTRRELRPRDLILDNYGRRGIVMAREGGTPNPKWLARQKDVRMRDPGLTVWLTVQPLTGGGACVPDGLSELIGEATAEDVAEAARAASPTGVSLLKALFPEMFGA